MDGIYLDHENGLLGFKEMMQEDTDGEEEVENMYIELTPGVGPTLATPERLLSSLSLSTPF